MTSPACILSATATIRISAVRTAGGAFQL